MSHQAMQDALAETAIGTAQHGRRPRAQHGLQNRAAGHDEVGPTPARCTDAPRRAALVMPRSCPDTPADRAAIEHQPIDPSAIVAAQVQVHRRERGDRAGRADQLHRRPFPGWQDPLHAVVDRGARAEPCSRRSRRRVRSERLGEGDHADRHRRAGRARNNGPPSSATGSRCCRRQCRPAGPARRRARSAADSPAAPSASCSWSRTSSSIPVPSVPAPGTRGRWQRGGRPRSQRRPP